MGPCRVEQERVARELQGLQERLEAKEASLAQLQTSSAVLALKANYDRVIADLASERDGLQKERLQLTQARHPRSKLESSRLRV